MRDVCRVYFQEASTLRSFYWFESAQDHSIYFGTSNTKHFKTGRTGAVTAEIGGTRVLPNVEGRPMSEVELKSKNSIHGSGVVNLPVQAEALRQRYKISPPRDGFNELPLVAILPMQPSKYPASPKTPKATDLVLNASNLSPHPLGLLFYLANPGAPAPLAVVAAKSEYEFFVIESTPLGYRRLYACIYAHPERLKIWPPQEVELLAHPPSDGQPPNWPFFG